MGTLIYNQSVRSTCDNLELGLASKVGKEGQTYGTEPLTYKV